MILPPAITWALTVSSLISTSCQGQRPASAKGGHLRHQALHDGVDAIPFRAAGDQRAVAAGLAVLLVVVLQRLRHHRLWRHHHELRAALPPVATLHGGGVGAGRGQRGGQRGKDRARVLHAVNLPKVRQAAIVAAKPAPDLIWGAARAVAAAHGLAGAGGDQGRLQPQVDGGRVLVIPGHEDDQPGPRRPSGGRRYGACASKVLAAVWRGSVNSRG